MSDSVSEWVRTWSLTFFFSIIWWGVNPYSLFLLIVVCGYCCRMDFHRCFDKPSSKMFQLCATTVQYPQVVSKSYHVHPERKHAWTGLELTAIALGRGTWIITLRSGSVIYSQQLFCFKHGLQCIVITFFPFLGLEVKLYLYLSVDLQLLTMKRFSSSARTNTRGRRHTRKKSTFIVWTVGKKQQWSRC